MTPSLLQSPLFKSRLSYLCTVAAVWLQRSPLLIRIAQVQLSLAPRYAQVLKAALPAVTFFGGVHRVTGATVVVPVAPSVNPANATVGESFSWVFRTTGEKAEAYSVTGLPAGVKLSTSVNQGVSSIGGVPTVSGKFTVKIIGWEHVGLSGAQTPAYSLVLNVAAGDPPAITTPPVGGTFETGETAVLAVESTGAGLNYVWKKDGQPIPSAIDPWVSSATVKEAFVPTKSIGNAWREETDAFDASGWLSGTSGIGYENSTTYNPFFKIDLGDQMFNKATTAYIRIPFTLDETQHATANHLKLRMQYDDGFVAYLNGQKVLAVNAPANPAWNSTASAGHDDALAVEFEEWDLAEFVPLLRQGTNLLAIQGLNDGKTSSDFLINPELLGGRDTNAAELKLVGLTEADSGLYTVEVSNGAGSEVSTAAKIEVNGITPVAGYAIWQTAHWDAAQVADPEVAGRDADPDGDGLINALEYVGGSDPNRSESAPSVRVRAIDVENVHQLLLEFPRDASATDVAVVVEASATLEGTWETLAEGVTTQHTETEWRVQLPVDTTRRFLRFSFSFPQ